MILCDSASTLHNMADLPIWKLKCGLRSNADDHASPRIMDVSCFLTACVQPNSLGVSSGRCADRNQQTFWQLELGTWQVLKTPFLGQIFCVRTEISFTSHCDPSPEFCGQFAKK
jgi:hypothetical protein